jgi:hypothetical protein
MNVTKIGTPNIIKYVTIETNPVFEKTGAM